MTVDSCQFSPQLTMDNCQLGGTIQPHRLNDQPAARHVAKITGAVEWYHHRYTKNCQLSIVNLDITVHCQLSTSYEREVLL